MAPTPAEEDGSAGPPPSGAPVLGSSRSLSSPSPDFRGRAARRPSEASNPQWGFSRRPSLTTSTAGISGREQAFHSRDGSALGMMAVSRRASLASAATASATGCWDWVVQRHTLLLRILLVVVLLGGGGAYGGWSYTSRCSSPLPSSFHNRGCDH